MPTRALRLQRSMLYVAGSLLPRTCADVVRDGIGLIRNGPPQTAETSHSDADSSEAGTYNEESSTRVHERIENPSHIYTMVAIGRPKRTAPQGLRVKCFSLVPIGVHGPRLF